MASFKFWTPDEAVVVYYLVLWGLKNKDVIELSAPLLEKRTNDGIASFTSDVRKLIDIESGGSHSYPPSPSTIKLLKIVKEMDPPKSIADLGKKDVAGSFIKPITKAGGYDYHLSKKRSKSPILAGDSGYKLDIDRKKSVVRELNERELPFPSQREKNLLDNIKKTFETSKLKKDFDLSKNLEPNIEEVLFLEEVLRIAKKAGAKKVEWNSYVIKFR